MRFHVPDMSCNHCTAAITKGVQGVDPAARVETDLGAKTVTVDSALPEEAVATAIRSAGYAVTPA